MIRRILLGVLASLAFAAPASADTGTYLDFAARPPFETSSNVMMHVQMGSEGVPVVNYVQYGIHNNPVTVTNWGLQRYSRWLLYKQPTDRAYAIRAADWLVKHQTAQGTWIYDLSTTGAGVVLKAPWISAMAQGETMSLFVRAYALTGNHAYIDTALKAYKAFVTPVEQGGVRTNWSGLPWFEEYPGVGSTHVLNGYEFAIIGLRDLSPYSATINSLWVQGLNSLIARINIFDAPAYRSQYYAALGAGRSVSTPDYKHAHSILTRYLARVSGNATLAAYATKWEGYERPARTAAAKLPTVAPAPVVKRVANRYKKKKCNRRTCASRSHRGRIVR